MRVIHFFLAVGGFSKQIEGIRFYGHISPKLQGIHVKISCQLFHCMPLLTMATLGPDIQRIDPPCPSVCPSKKWRMELPTL